MQFREKSLAKAQNVTKSGGFELGRKEEVDFCEVDVSLELDCWPASGMKGRKSNRNE